MMQWFGKDWGAPLCHDTLHVATPTGIPCAHCKEPIAADDNGVILNDGTYPEHYECFMRSIVGSVGHQMGECSCHGMEDLSEIGLSRREAALRAEKCHFLFHAALQKAGYEN